jgi:hypothetical protein
LSFFCKLITDIGLFRVLIDLRDIGDIYGEKEEGSLGSPLRGTLEWVREDMVPRIPWQFETGDSAKG